MSDSIGKKSFGFLYVTGYRNLTKIGITQNPQRRMSELKPDIIYRIFTAFNYEDLEKKAHGIWVKNRVPQSEYFELEDVDRDVLFDWLKSQAILLSKIQT